MHIKTNQHAHDNKQNIHIMYKKQQKQTFIHMKKK